MVISVSKLLRSCSIVSGVLFLEKANRSFEPLCLMQCLRNLSCAWIAFPLLRSGVRGQSIDHAFLSDPQSTERCQSNCGLLDALSMKLGLPCPFLVQSCQLLFPVVLCCQLPRFRQLLVLWRQGSCCLQNRSPFICTLVTQPTHCLVIGESVRSAVKTQQQVLTTVCKMHCVCKMQ